MTVSSTQKNMLPFILRAKFVVFNRVWAKCMLTQATHIVGSDQYLHRVTV